MINAARAGRQDSHYAAISAPALNGNPHMHRATWCYCASSAKGAGNTHSTNMEPWRVLARDGNLIVSSTSATQLAGPLLFTTTTTPAGDGRDLLLDRQGLNWDAYGHNQRRRTRLPHLTCTPDANGYNTDLSQRSLLRVVPGPITEPVQANAVRTSCGGPVTLPDANLFTNGPWYGGSPYLGPMRRCALPVDGTTLLPGRLRTLLPRRRLLPSCGTPITNGDHHQQHFPGGMLMMMLVDLGIRDRPNPNRARELNAILQISKQP